FRQLTLRVFYQKVFPLLEVLAIELHQQLEIPCTLCLVILLLTRQLNAQVAYKLSGLLTQGLRLLGD
ncbi:MAG: hypothetical protein ACKO96_44510, partial [Flammeovirgaceae bacterium]